MDTNYETYFYFLCTNTPNMNTNYETYVLQIMIHGYEFSR